MSPSHLTPRLLLALASSWTVLACAGSIPVVQPDDAGAETSRPDGDAGGPKIDLPATDGKGTSDACVAACALKACGAPNGCGGTCQTGTCPTGSTCVKGTCASCDRWGTSVSGAVKDLVVDKGEIFVTGAVGAAASAQQVYVGVLDACGVVKNKITFTPKGGSAGGGSGVAVTGSQIYVGGWLIPSQTSDPMNGLLVGLSRGTLSASFSRSLWGSAGKDEVWDVALAGGAVWMGGTNKVSSSPGVWGVKGTADGKSMCGFKVMAPTSFGRRLATSSGYVYLTGFSNSKGIVTRYPATACQTSPCVSCAAPWSRTFQDGSNKTTGQDLVVVGNNIYVVGTSATPGGKGRGIIFRLDAAGKVLGSHTWDPTTSDDMFLAVATDGSNLYIAGTKGYAGTLGAATAVIKKVSIPQMTAGWERSPGDSGGYWAVALHGPGGLVVGGATKTGGIVRRCSTGGACN